MGILNSYANNFWTQDERYETQRLYIQFSLFASAISDFAIGMELQNNSRLNWSASSFYYSMVHSGRFIIYSCLGNFPTSHIKLIEIINGGNYVFGDWLQKFWGRDNNFNERVSSDAMTEFYISIGINDFQKQSRQLGDIIDKSKKLREDSNYESLLIAHEFKHSFVSSNFDSLTQHLRTGSEIALIFISKIFERYLIKYPFPNILPNDVKGFIHYYLDTRIVNQLKERNFPESIIFKIKKILGNTFITIPLNINKFRQMEENVSFELFNMKTDLMRSFNRKITELDIAIGGESKIKAEWETIRRREIELEHLEAVNRKLKKAIFNAIKNKDVNAIIELRTKGVDLNHKNELGFSCLEFAKDLGVKTVIDALNKNLDEYKS